MVIGALAGAAASIAGIIAQSRAQQQQRVLDWMNLQFQKDQARKTNRLATATRSDPFGNKFGYDELLNEFITKLTPTQQRITKAGEREQLLSLTEDAERDRQLKRDQARRAGEADEEFDTQLAGYRYDQPPSEGATQDELVRTMLLNRRKGLQEGTKVLGAQALRMGRGGDIQELLKGADQIFGQSLEETILKGKQAGREESRAARNAHESRYGRSLDLFSNIAGRVNPSQVRFGDLPQRNDARQSEMLQALMKALQGGATNVGQAYSNAAGSAGLSPDFSGLASSLGNLKFGSGTGLDTFNADVYDPYSLDEEDRTLGDDWSF
jgi:hypothetical protein